jgi:hypothetical protein
MRSHSIRLWRFESTIKKTISILMDISQKTSDFLLLLACFMKYILLTLFIVLIYFESSAQSEKVKVFLNCRCDDDFIKQNTLVFDYVRDRTLSDIEDFVFEIINAGGEEITLLNTRVKMISKIWKTKSVLISPVISLL